MIEYEKKQSASRQLSRKGKKRYQPLILFSLGALFVLTGCSTVPRILAEGKDEGASTTTDGRSDVLQDRQGKWYRGDLHCHSRYSDGDAPLSEVIAHAEQTGLDFFVITDHDTSMRGKPTHWFDPAYTSRKMILLYGVEWTSRKGHANIWHTRPFDYTELWKANREKSAEEAAEAAHSEGARFSVNHPKVPYAPWEYKIPQEIDSIEIWNAPFVFPSNNRKTIDEVWDPLLLSGRRIPGVGGSDNHHIHHYQRNFNPHGYPTTWVFAEEPTAESILESILEGHVTISYSPEADRCDFSADVDGDGRFETICGDAVVTSGNVMFRVSLVPTGPSTELHWPWYKALIIKNGEPFREAILRESGSTTVTFQDTPRGYAYYRVELYALPWGAPGQDLVHGNTFAVTNPIYCNLPTSYE